MPNINGTANGDILTGDASNDTIVGNGGNDTLNGGAGYDLLVGNAGADVLNGGDDGDTLYSGDESPEYRFPYYGQPFTPPLLDTGVEIDTLNGGAGDDTIFAGYGDRIDGGVGYDRLFISFLGGSAGVNVDFNLASQVVGGATITGIESVSWIQGTNFADTIRPGSGSQDMGPIYGMGGNDALYAGYYTSVLDGGAGNDMLDGRSGGYLQELDGGDGDDTLYVYSSVTVRGGAGRDTIYGGGTTYGGAGDDLIIMQGNNYSQDVFGDEGNDEIRASSTGSTIFGGAGADLLTGDADRDWLFSAGGSRYGGLESDLGLEVDTVNGFGGDDLLGAGVGDQVDGGSGSDTLYFSFGAASAGINLNTAVFLTGQPLVIAGASLNSIEKLGRIRGTEFADTLVLTTQSISIEVDGGGGDDIITGAGSAVVATGGAGNDRFSSSTANDIFDGGVGNDRFQGSSGNDRFTGGDGDDYFISGAGNDIFEGGAGNDTADFSAATAALSISLSIVNNGSSTWLDGQGGRDELRSSIENLVGGSAGDTLTGDWSDNRLEGGAGDDILAGSGGADQLVGGAGVDTADYTGAWTAVTADLSAGVASNDGNSASDTLSGIENLTGSGSADVLTGDGAANVLKGNSGDDVLRGGAGHDTLDGGAGVDTAHYGTSSGAVVASLANGLASADGLGGQDVLTGIENLIGGSTADTLAGDAAVNRLEGGLGDDTLSGAGGNDVLVGGAGVDVAVFGGLKSAYTVTTTGGVTTVSGPDGVDTLDGIERLQFADGIFDLAGNLLVSLFTGTANADTLAGTEGSNTINGLGGNDVIDAMDGDDTIEGGLGDDSINGGAGVDTAVFADGASTVAINAGVVTVNGPDGVDTLTNVERLRFGGSTLAVSGMPASSRIGTGAGETLAGGVTAEGLFGLGGNDTLNGAEGDDILAGGAGVDILNGGTGVDTADYSAAAAGMRAQLNSNSSSNDGDGGTDTFSSIENLTGSAFNDTLIGDANVNVLRGGLGADTLLGLAGNDVLWGGSGTVNQVQGGLGDDRYILEANDSVVEVTGEGNDTVEARINAYVLALNVENLVFGGSGNFAATGNAQANTITGGDGNDNLRGRGGVDVLNGGAGTDTVDYTLAAAGVTARLDTMRATNDGDGATDTFSGIENLTGSVYNDLLIGNAGNNVLHGGIGTDTLLGFGGDDILWGGSGGGNNQLQGGTGNDYYVLDAFDTCVELAGEGIDTVEARIGSYTMGANIENLLYVGGTGTFVGTGNVLDNTITGGAGNDILRGRGGNDTIDGGLGKDEIQMRGLAADYTVTADGAGWRITDSVAGRDGSTFVTSIEVIRWSNNQVRTLSYPPVAASIGDATSKGGPEVSPLFAPETDGFVLPAYASDQAQVLPGLTFADAFDSFDAPSGLGDRLFLGLEAQLAQHDGWMTGLDHDGHGQFAHDWLV